VFFSAIGISRWPLPSQPSPQPRSLSPSLLAMARPKNQRTNRFHQQWTSMINSSGHILKNLTGQDDKQSSRHTLRYVPSFETDHQNDLNTSLAGPEALRARAIDDSSCSRCCLSPMSLRLPSSRHIGRLVAVLPHSLHYRRDCEPKPLPSNS